MGHEQKALVKCLTRLLRENGERILSDGVPLCLAAGFLRFLNEAFMSISDDDFCTSFEALPGTSPIVPLSHELQFLYDFVQKTPTLKLIHDSVMASDPVSIVAFRSLRHLVLKKIPVQHVSGLSKIRGRLQTLLCTHSVSSLKDLLEMCGADRSAALVWTQLNTLYLAYNDIITLDNSLRLLPILESLDLSHNMITYTDNHLEHLTELHQANLSYNLLVIVPSFSLSSSSKLSLLSLRHNCLEHIEGIQELVGLQELDLSHNCLSLHHLLQPLKVLHKLKLLMLAGNPLCHHAKHRPLTIEQLHPLAVKKLVLDGKPISDYEQMFSGRTVTRDVSRLLPRRPPQLDREGDYMTNSLPTGYHSDPMSDYHSNRPTEYASDGGSLQSSTQIHSEDGEIVQKRSTRRSKPPRKPRKVEISDQGEDPEAIIVPIEPSSYDSRTLSSSYSDQHRDMKKKIETIRVQCGDNWLSTLTATRGTASTLTDHPEPANQSKDHKTLSANQRQDNSKLANQSEDHPEAANKERSGSHQVEATNQEEESNSHSTNTSVDNNNINDSSTNQNTEIARTADLEHIEASILGLHNKTPDDSVERRERVESSSDDIYGKQSISDSAVRRTGSSGPVLDTPLSAGADGKEQAFVWSRNDTDTVDYGEESEAFFVQVPGADGHHADHCILSVSERYLLEKNIEAVVIEALDLKCLQSARIVTGKEESVKHASSEHSVVLQLFFDYYKKDRAERCYIMEDSTAAQSVLDLLEPFLELKEMSAALQERVQCLKCSTEFSKTEGQTAAHKTPDADKDLVCPFCGSNKVIELDIGQVSRSVGRSGVMTSGSRSQSMLHEPTAQSTPVKAEAGINRQLFGLPAHDGGSMYKSHSAKSLTFNPSDGLNQDPSTPRAADQTPLRAGRQDSDTSDIMVIDSKPPSSGDIDEDKSQSRLLSPIPGQAQTPPVGTPGNLTNQELSPCGSLSGNTIHSMVSSIYENSLNMTDSHQRTSTSVRVTEDSSLSNSSHGDSSHRNNKNGDSTLSNQGDSSVLSNSIRGDSSSHGSSHHDDSSFQSLPDPSLSDMKSCLEPDSTIEDSSCSLLPEEVRTEPIDPSMITFSHTDYTHIDHRLKLYLGLHVLEEDEFCQIIQSGVVHALEPSEFRGLLIISTTTLYIFKIKGPTSADAIGSWLCLLQKQRLRDIQVIEIGVGGSIHFLSDNDSNCFLLLLRDEKRCKRFLKVFTAHLQDAAFSSDSQLVGIRTDRRTPRNVGSQLLTVSDSEPSHTDIDTTVSLFARCHLQIGALDSGGSGALTAVSVVVTGSHVAMAAENHHILLTRSHDMSHDMTGSCDTSRSSDSATEEAQQFQLKDVQLISDISSIELSRSKPCDIRLVFTEEGATEQYTWRLLVETTDTRDALVAALKACWEQQFGVEFTLDYS